MPRHFPNRAVLLCVSVAVCCSSARAETVRYISEHDEVLYQAELEESPMRGVDYVSLTSLLNQFGGAITIQPSRVRIDLANATAFVKGGEQRVSALSIFSLQHPILELNDALWIAEIDVVPFFLKSFRMEVRRGAAIPGAAPMSAESSESRSGQSVARLTNREAESLTPRGSSFPIAPVVRFETVVLDPGHGGADAGILSSSGLSEKDLTLDLANRLASQLDDRVRQTVVLTRQEDMAITHAQRARMAQNLPESLVVSIHAATEPSGLWRGIGVYRHLGVGLTPGNAPRVDAGTLLQNNIETQLRQRFPDTPMNSAALPLQLFNAAARPGVLIEVGFLSNPEDAVLLADDAHRDHLVEAIAEAIAQLLANQNDDANTTPQTPAQLQEFVP